MQEISEILAGHSGEMSRLADAWRRYMGEEFSPSRTMFGVVWMLAPAPDEVVNAVWYLKGSWESYARNSR